MENKEKTNIFDKIWNFFASVKLAVVILIILALTSIIGTIVEQRAEPATNIALLAKFFGDATAPTVYNIFVKIGFMDMYHSWWFVSLLILFSINLTVCSLERFPKTWKLAKKSVEPLAEGSFKSMGIKKELVLIGKPEKLKELLKKQIKKTLFGHSKLFWVFWFIVSLPVFLVALYRYLYVGPKKIKTTTNGKGFQIYSEAGNYTRLGVYIVHLSILLIFVGAIIGARFGFRGFLNLPEGESSDVAYTTGGKTIRLGFTIKCNWYNTEYYSGGDMPREFQSELVIIDGGREILKKVIEVNHPLTYNGVTFYQSSYGMIPNAVGEFDLAVISKDGRKNALQLRLGESFEIPSSNIKGTIVDFSPALGMDPQTGALATYSETMVNPAVAIEFDEPGKEKFTGWILERYPKTGILPDGSQIKFLDYWGVEYTGLQVSKDPGVGIIYFACIIMTLGLYAAFFMSHKKIWIRLTPDTSGEKGSVRITVGGSASKNRLSFERDIEKMLSKASRAIEGSPQRTCRGRKE